MAKNYNNDSSGGILQTRASSTKSSAVQEFEKLNKRPKYLVWSFIVIIGITLLSFAIPEKYYHKDPNLLLLNAELLVLFWRDIFLYFKRSCKMIKVIFILMVLIYSVNIGDLLVNIPHSGYLTLSLSIIVAALGIIYFIGWKNKD